MIESFKQYKNFGLSCLPVKKDKSPDTKDSWLSGITNKSAYENCHGIGIICGMISGNLECLDFDNHFGDAKTNFSKFIAEIKDLYNKYKFPIESTQSGGFHFIYSCKKIGGNQKLASRPLLRNDKWIPDAIIETRGEGGYFVADPTPNYKWIRNNILDVPEITIEERKFIIEVCKSFNEWHEIRKESFEQKDKPGDLFNDDITSKDQMISCLKSHGWNEVRNGIFRRPDKKEGISATVGKVADNIFYNFSSNAYPFEPNKAYTPFQVIALLDYNADFSKFAKELAVKYCENKPIIKEYGKPTPVEEKKDKNKLEYILQKSYIDLNIPIEKPPVALKIRNFENGYINEQRLFTLGNFSAITGKSKSKKSMLTSVMLAAASSNLPIYDKIIGYLPSSKNAVLLFDTEQSDYDAFISGKRVIKILGHDIENFGTFNLREYTPKERCEIIDYALEKFKDNIGFVVIDGIVDLSNAINDELEASKVVNLLMKWTKLYNCHITTVIHQNKNDNYATGHIGSAILKKAEAIISVTKKEGDSFKSIVKCDNIRGVMDFNDFEIEINDNGIPEINDLLNTHYEIKTIDF